MVLLSGSLVGSATSELQAAAAASPRPHVCRLLHRQASLSVWRRVDDTGLATYCRMLARASGRLNTDPAVAAKLAGRAHALMPEAAGALVLAGRAAVRRGQLAVATTYFDRATTIDRRSLEAPAIMFDQAFAAWRTGKRSAALKLYRSLVPRASLMPSRQARALTLLRAAHLTMGFSAAAPPHERAPLLRQAIAYLREAHRDPHHRLRRDVSLSLAMALLVAGRPGSAQIVLNEDKNIDKWAPRPQADYLDRAHDNHLLQALALERQAPRDADSHYATFLSDPRAPFRDAITKRAKTFRIQGQR